MHCLLHNVPEQLVIIISIKGRLEREGGGGGGGGREGGERGREGEREREREGGGYIHQAKHIPQPSIPCTMYNVECLITS